MVAHPGARSAPGSDRKGQSQPEEERKMTHKDGPIDAPTSSVPETAITAELDQLLDGYFAAFNDYDVDAIQAVISDS